MQAKGAKVMIFSQTPEMQYTPGSATPLEPTRFVKFAHDLVMQESDVTYFDHYEALADYLRLCGASKAASFFVDHRHMNKVGAQHAAEIVLQWLRETNSDLRNWIIGDNDTLPGSSSKTSDHLSRVSARGHRKRRLSSY